MRHLAIFLLVLGFVITAPVGDSKSESHESHEKKDLNETNHYHHDGLHEKHGMNETEFEKNETENNEKGPRHRRDDSLWNQASNLASNTFNSASDAFSNGVGAMTNGVSNWGQQTGKQAESYFNNDVKPALNTFGQQAQNTFGQAQNAISTGFNQASGVVSNGWSDLKNNVNALSNTWNAVTGQPTFNAFSPATGMQLFNNPASSFPLTSQTGVPSNWNQAQQEYDRNMQNTQNNWQIQPEQQKNIFNKAVDWFKSWGK